MLNLMCVTNAFCRGRVSRTAGMHFFRESLINVESEKIGTCKAADADAVNYPPEVSEYRDLIHYHS